MFASGDQTNWEGFKVGTLVRLNHKLNKGLLSRSLLKQVISHFGTVAYVDLHDKND